MAYIYASVNLFGGRRLIRCRKTLSAWPTAVEACKQRPCIWITPPYIVDRDLAPPHDADVAAGGCAASGAACGEAAALSAAAALRRHRRGVATAWLPAAGRHRQCPRHLFPLLAPRRHLPGSPGTLALMFDCRISPAVHSISACKFHVRSHKIARHRSGITGAVGSKGRHHERWLHC